MAIKQETKDALIGMGALCLIIAILWVASLPSKNRQNPITYIEQERTNAHAGYCKIYDCNGMTRDEFVALRNMGLLKDQPAKASGHSTGAVVAAGVGGAVLGHMLTKEDK